jgi:hypothetical protein
MRAANEKDWAMTRFFIMAIFKPAKRPIVARNNSGASVKERALRLTATGNSPD